MILKPADELREFVAKILTTAGASEANASEVAEHLVLANLNGVDSHGVWHVLGYVQSIQNGFLDPKASPKLIKETPNSAHVAGQWTFGHVAARFTMDHCIEKAKSTGMAVGGLVEANHIGRLGHYVELAATEGLISMVVLGGQGRQSPTAVPFGGSGKLMHTNPIAMGFPGSDGPAMFFDYATTSVAGVKVVNAHRRQEQLPPGCIVDSDGNPTTDPNDFFNGGGHLAFGGHKGYALMMATEYLGRIFTNANAFIDEERGGMYDRYAGTFMIAFKADLFQPMDEYTHFADEMAERTRAVAPAPGVEKVLVPGDMEAAACKVRERDGLPIEDDVWSTIVEAAELLGVESI